MPNSPRWTYNHNSRDWTRTLEDVSLIANRDGSWEIALRVPGGIGDVLYAGEDGSIKLAKIAADATLRIHRAPWTVPIEVYATHMRRMVGERLVTFEQWARRSGVTDPASEDDQVEAIAGAATGIFMGATAATAGKIRAASGRVRESDELHARYRAEVALIPTARPVNIEHETDAAYVRTRIRRTIRDVLRAGGEVPESALQGVPGVG